MDVPRSAEVRDFTGAGGADFLAESVFLGAGRAEAAGARVVLRALLAEDFLGAFLGEAFCAMDHCPEWKMENSTHRLSAFPGAQCRVLLLYPPALAAVKLCKR
jgi:hypothetical protein